MNNEPVAWIKQNPETLQAELHFDKPAKYWATVVSNPDIPLYTHQYERPHNTVLVPCDKLAEMQAEIEALKAHPVKEMSETRIKQIFVEQTGFYFDDNPADDLALMDFAKALLLEAQEK